MPYHSHVQRATVGTGSWNYTAYYTPTEEYKGNLTGVTPTGTLINNGNIPLTTAPDGEDEPHNNMPPYVAVNIWKRVA